MGCDKCDGGFVFKMCCAGLSNECGCMGMPYGVTNCKVCNAENKEPEDAELIEQLQYVEWFDE